MNASLTSGDQGVGRFFERLSKLRARSGARIALVAVVLFLVFDFTALALNFWLSYRIETQAVNINLAGRQRMLSQRMVKVLLQIEDQRALDQGSGDLMQELARTYRLFDNTLESFANGGVTTAALGAEIELAPLEGASNRALINNALSLWKPYREAVGALLYTQAGDSDTLQRAVTLARSSNLELLDLMNRLTTELERQTQREARQIRFFQGLAFVLALLNFSFALSIYLLDLRRTHRELDLIDSIINRVAAGVLVADKWGNILRVNQPMESLFGYSESELLGHPVGSLIREEAGERFGSHRDGRQLHCSVEVSQAQLSGRPVQVYTVVDVSDERKARDRLSVLAYHDQLTGLPNRLLFDDRLKLELNHARRRNSVLAVLFIDLDCFKPINDNCGHDVGDQVLRQLALRMTATLRNSDTVSRWGGDEFTVILTDLESVEDGITLANTLIGEITKPYRVEGGTLELGASVGMACYPVDGESAALLLQRADQAMYWAKRNETGTLALFSGLTQAEQQESSREL